MQLHFHIQRFTPLKNRWGKPILAEAIQGETIQGSVSTGIGLAAIRYRRQLRLGSRLAIPWAQAKNANQAEAKQSTKEATKKPAQTLRASCSVHSPSRPLLQQALQPPSLGNQGMELGQGPLPREPFGGHSKHKTQHGQTAIEELGGVVKSPGPLLTHQLHGRLNGPGVEQVRLIGAPALILRFRKTTPG